MPRIIYAGVIAAMSVLIFSAPLQAQSPSAPQASAGKAKSSAKVRNLRQEIAKLEEKSRIAEEDEKWVPYYAANMKLNALLPYQHQYLVNVIEACAMIDRKTSAYHYMLQLQQQGFSYDFNSTERTLQIRQTEAYEYINDMLIDAGKTAGVAMPVFTLPGEAPDFRSIAWDPGRERFLVGTAADGRVIAVSDTGESRVLLEADNENGLWSVTGIAVDAGNNRLWLSSAALLAFQGYSPADKNHGALIEFDLETLEKLGHYNMPVDALNHEPGSIAVTDDGTVYVIDRATPIIYRKAPGADRLEAFFANPEMLGLTDIAVTPDNSRIFVSDPLQGIMVIDPVGQAAASLSGPETMNVGGVEGIEYQDGNLFIIQGDFSPQRVVRLQLDSVTGAAVESVAPMVIALEEFDHPTFGTIRDNDLFFFANSSAVDGSGLMVMSTPLDAGAEVAPPDLSEFEKALRSRTQ
jgi:DNA-binding beta-propeller fold protein YncE